MSPEADRPLSARTTGFRHRPLDLDEPQIRLLHVEQEVDDPSNFYLVLKHVNLGSEPKYNAVSYAWGDQEDSRAVPIVYEGSLAGREYLTITRNLYDFFSSCAEHASSNGELWVDQVCIDQSNNLEKGHQVDQMARVFQRAENVIAWLGHEFTWSLCSEALTVIEHTWHGWRNASALAFIREFIRVSYWTRLWICQEFILARSILFRLGESRDSTRYRTHELSRISTVRLRHFFAFDVPMSDLKNWSVEEQVAYARVQQLIKKREGWAHPVSWINVIALAEHRQCQDVRDKIYGLLSLVPERDKLPPDYDLSIGEILGRLKKLLRLSQGDSTTWLQILIQLFREADGSYLIDKKFFLIERARLERKGLVNHPAFLSLREVDNAYSS